MELAASDLEFATTTIKFSSATAEEIGVPVSV